MSVYTAVTIGPIVDTLSLTSSPAGLWGASYLFSWISRRMIHHLKEAGVPEDRFVSPCITLDPKCETMWKKGVGLFHDRIIFRSDGLNEPMEMVKTAKEKTIYDLAEAFSQEEQLNTKVEDIRDWLQGYLRIYAAQKETSNPLMDLGATLSRMELEPHFPGQDQENLLLRLLEDGSKEGGQNSKVKKFLPTDRNADTWLLKGEGNSVRDLKDIAAAGTSGSDRKYSQYYAVLYSDGDSMSKILERITDQDEKIREFSKNCLTFCAQAAQQVQEYGGVPLYAGGDDLLALLPVCGNHSCTIFGLVESLRELFNQNFQKYREELGGKPTISMGISIQYYKSPLYEALEQARNLLFGDSKRTALKNACCIHLQKHSGQSVKLCEEWMDYDGKENLFAALDKLLRDTEQSGTESKEEDQKFLAGAGATVEKFREVFCQAMKDQDQDQTQVALHNLYENLFDNADQKKFKEYLKGLEDLTVQLVQKVRDNVAKAGEGAVDPEKIVTQLQYVIRVLHFMKEKGAEEA